MPTLSTGVISATRTRLAADGGFALDDVIQTDAPAAAGDAGGPLLNAEGEVIGVVGRLMVAGVPVRFAVPASTVARLVPELEASGRVRRALLGIRGDGPDSAGGVRVQAVRPGSPAEQAGVRRGDTVRALAGKRVRSIDDLRRVLAAHEPGERVSLSVGRRDRPATRMVRLADRPAGIADR
jgi:S1-C subfamily serine protease